MPPVSPGCEASPKTTWGPRAHPDYFRMARQPPSNRSHGLQWPKSRNPYQFCLPAQ